MKIKLLVTEKELAEELKKAKISLTSWYDDLSSLSSVLSDNGIDLWFLWPEGEVCVAYYSNKLGHNVLLSTDAFQFFDTYEEMARAMLDYHNEAQNLEAKINI